MSRLVEELPNRDEPKLCRVSQEELPYFWDIVLEIMKEHPRGLLDVMSVDEVLNGIQVGLFDLWVGVDKKEVEVAVLTSFSRHAFVSILYVVWGGGIGKKYWRVGIETIEHYAQIIGADTIRVQTTRQGVLRIAKKYGYLPEEIILVKRFEQPTGKWRH